MMIGSAVDWLWAVRSGGAFMGTSSLSLAQAQRSLQPAAGAGHGKAEYKVHHRDKEVNLRLPSEPRGVGQDAPGDAQQLQEPDDGYQGGVLEQADELAHDGGQHGPQRLGQDDEDQRLNPVKPQGVGGFDLPARHALQAEIG